MLAFPTKPRKRNDVKMNNNIIIIIVTLFCYRKNEELDDKAVIRKLRLKIEELENEVSLLRQGSNTSISQEVNLYEPPVHNYCTCFFS